MKLRTRTWALVLAVQLASLVASRAGAAEDAVPCERRLPRDVVAYVSVRNVDEFRKQWLLTQTGQLVLDEALADFRGAIESQIAELSGQIQEKIGFSLSDLLNIPHGEVVAAVAIQSDGKPSVVVMLNFGSQEEQVARLLEKLDDTERDLTRSEEEFEETKLVVFRKAADEGNQPPQDIAARFVKDGFLVVANGVPALKSVLNRWDGKHENVLAENPVYRYIADKCRDEGQEALPLLNWFIDPLGIVKAGIAAQSQANPQAGLVLTMLPLLGVDKFKGVGGSFDMARGEFDMVSRTLVYLEPPVRGLLNMFQFDAGGQAPPKWVSGQATSYFGISWNIARAYSAAESLVDSFQGAGAFSRLVQQLADNEASGGFHLKKDIIDHLTGRIHVIGETSGDDDDETETYLVAAEVKTAAGAKAVLRKLAQIPGVQIKEREFQGETLYEVESPQGEDDDSRMGVVVAENHMMFATDVKLLERVLRGTDGAESLADSPAYRRIARRFPEKTASISFNREENPLKGLAAALNSPAIAQLSPDLAELAEKLPPAEAIRKYGASSGSYMLPDERGLRITSFTLKKDAE